VVDAPVGIVADPRPPDHNKEDMMLYYALVFLFVAIIAGLLGFGAIAFAAAGIAKLLFYIFLILFVISLVTHVSRRA
jgi:uncharacterized membrane protein YtjA (UPF0391 family)